MSKLKKSKFLKIGIFLILMIALIFIVIPAGEIFSSGIGDEVTFWVEQGTCDPGSGTQSGDYYNLPGYLWEFSLEGTILDSGDFTGGNPRSWTYGPEVLSPDDYTTTFRVYSSTSGDTYELDTVNFTVNTCPVPTIYNVTYNGNSNTGGAVPTDGTNYHTGDTATVLGNTGSLIRTGYTFAGWNTAANGSGTSYTGGDTFAIGSSNVTLYAQWTAVPTTTPKPETTETTLPIDGSIEEKYESTKSGFVTLLYNRILGRGPDSEGFAAWLERIENGIFTGADIVSSFIFGEESQSNIGDYSNEEFITFLYQVLFNREPDYDGFNAWLFRMTDGMTNEEVVSGFTHSEEFINLCNIFGIKPYEGYEEIAE